MAEPDMQLAQRVHYRIVRLMRLYFLAGFVGSILAALACVWLLPSADRDAGIFWTWASTTVCWSIIFVASFMHAYFLGFEDPSRTQSNEPQAGSPKDGS
jgi:hypothetical protein